MSCNPKTLSFMKMHGLGNDFVIIDARNTPVVLNRDSVRAMGDRRRGIGFDQLAVITPAAGMPDVGISGGPAGDTGAGMPDAGVRAEEGAGAAGVPDARTMGASGGRTMEVSGTRAMGRAGAAARGVSVVSQADFALTFWNADGSQAEACGNATRCVAAYDMATRDSAAYDRVGEGQTGVRIQTPSGILQAHKGADGDVRVNMGHPFTRWDDIPLADDVDTTCLPIHGDPVATGMGNPHCTFFVRDVDDVDLAVLGPQIEHHPLFPNRTNVQIVHTIARNHLRMRVWERGAGITLASGSSSCAGVVAAVRRQMIDKGDDVKVTLDGGDLLVHWADDGVWMSGPTAHVYNGEWFL